MLLRWRHERLEQVDVPLTAVGHQLRLQTVVAEALDVHRRKRHLKRIADAASKRAMSVAGKDDYVAHACPWCRVDVTRLTLARYAGPPHPDRHRTRAARLGRAG